MSTMGLMKTPPPGKDDVEEAVARYGAEMYGLAVAITGNVHDAEDAYQSAWSNALGHWEQLRDISKRRSWLASTVARSAMQVRRRRAFSNRWHVTLSEAPDLSTVMRWDPGLGSAIAHLSARQRAVITLHFGHGFTLDEVAAILECRGGTVRSHLARALATLRVRLGDERA
jgi:RNA polymerase sigma factor (sigma-70 family)